MTIPIKLYSKSSVEKDWKCPRSYYYAYEYNGKGIQEQSKGLALFLGSALHDGLAAIATMEKAGEPVDIDLIATTAHEQVFNPLYELSPNDPSKVEFAYEQAAMVEGMLRGYFKHVWPQLMAQYSIWLIEEPFVYRHGTNLGMMSKADIVLESRLDGSKWYLEYKSTSSKKEEWITSWETAIQVHSSVKAIQQATGVECAGVIIQGLYKGYVSYGKQNSPFCYAYFKGGQPPFSKDQVGYEYRSGWKKTPTWQLNGGVKDWVAAMPSEILANQFPQTPPIMVNDELIEAFFRQQEARQDQIAQGRETMEICGHLDDLVMDSVFPQRFDQCRPAYGFDCAYVKLCHGPAQDPLENGFTYRDTEHLAPFLEKLNADQV